MKNTLAAAWRTYKKDQLRADFIAALVVTAIAIPESLAFAAIVGLPVQVGLYCALVAPVVFALITSSKHLIIGADSATAALVAAGASTVAVAGTDAYGNAIAVLGVLTAVILLVMAISRFGFMADLISRPVLVGFLAGIGLQLIVTKLPEAVGIEGLNGSLLHKLQNLAENMEKFDPVTMVFSLTVMVTVVIANRRRLPGALVGLVAAIAVSALLGLEQYGLKMIGDIQPGLPSLVVPQVSWDMLTSLVPIAGAIALVVLMQSSATIRHYATKYDEPVHDNRDLTALGFANAASALFQGFAVNGSPPRTAANDSSGGRTQMVNIFMAGLVALVLVFATPVLRVTPMAALAAIIITIGLHMIDLRQLLHIWHVRRAECAVAVAALLSVAILGVEQGVIIAIVIAVIERLRRQYHPKDEILMRDQQLASWAKVRLGRNHKRRSSPPGMLVYRFDGSLFFENISYFTTRLAAAISEAKEPVSSVVLDAGAISDIDYTGSEALKRLAHKLKADDIRLCLAHVPPSLRALLKRYGLLDLIGDENIFATLNDAIEAYPASRRTTFEMVQRLNLPDHGYVVIGGGVLEALSIRDTNAVDLVVSDHVYKQFRAKGWKEYVQDDGKHILSHNGYQIMTRYMGRGLHELREGGFMLHDVYFMNLTDLLQAKIKLGRPKDRADAKLIREYLRKHPEATSAAD